MSTISRLLAGSIVTAVALIASPAYGGNAPRKVTIEAEFEDLSGGTIDLKGKAMASMATFKLEADNLLTPLSGEYVLVLHGPTEDREIGRFAVECLEEGEGDGSEAGCEFGRGDAEARFRFQEDWRIFLLGAETLQLLDGDVLVEEIEVHAEAKLKIGALARGGEGRPRQCYGVAGRFEREEDGATSYEIRAKAKRTVPESMLVFRLNGPSGFLDIPVETDDQGDGETEVGGNEDLMAQAMQWTELIVLDGETEIARTPIVCR